MKGYDTPPTPFTADPFELGWAVGFIEGEGHVNKSNRHIVVSQSSVEPPAELLRLRAALGGSVNGPYHSARDGGKYYGPLRPHWTWQSAASDRAQLINTLAPLMCGPKGRQIMERI